MYVYACVNPDGRAFSQSTDGNWRKNRRPAPSGAGARCVGVDLNRNFDFLWDHSAKFAADAGVRTSADPCDYQVYRGPSPASEPETQNVVWVLDTYPRIRWLVDVHSAVPVVLHSWGSDTNQSTTPGDNFANPALDAARGRAGDGIGEFILDQHQSMATGLAGRMRDGVLAVRGVDYPVEQAMTLYPTSGASDDYAYSRHFVDPARPLVLGWCVECGTSFQPPYGEAEEVIKETSSGLLRFALSLHELTPSAARTDRRAGAPERHPLFQARACGCRTGRSRGFPEARDQGRSSEGAVMDTSVSRRSFLGGTAAGLGFAFAGAGSLEAFARPHPGGGAR